MRSTLSSTVLRGRRRTRTCVCAALVVVGAAVAAVAAPASAGLTGYGPVGPDPASQLGLSVPVLAAQVGGPTGSVVTADLTGATVTVTQPPGYSAGSQVVSVTDLSGDGVAEALLPADMLVDVEVVLGLGVGVRPVETAQDGTGVQGRAYRAAPATSAVRQDVAAAAGAATRADALTALVTSPTLVGATVVVVADDSMDTVLSATDSMTLELDGPAAIFALRPVEASVAPSVAPQAETGAGPRAQATVAAAGDAEPGTIDEGASRLGLVVGAVAALVAGAAVVVLVRRSQGGRRRAGRR